MLTIIVEEQDLFNEENETFETLPQVIIELEHSLISLSKWESRHQVPFLSSRAKTAEEILSYLSYMVLTPDLDHNVLYRCSDKNIDEIQKYIDSSQSATTFGELPERKGVGEVITAELIYYWMVAFNIPFECQYWHLNRLFALIRICHVKNSKPKKMSRHEIAQRNKMLNEQRKAQLGTRG